MNKRILALLLVLCLLSGAQALAVEEDTPEAVPAAAAGGFTRFKRYTGQFSDLSPDSVFYDNVAALYEYGLAGGKADGTYGLQDELTVGQAIIFAARIHGLYHYGDAESGPDAFYAAGRPAAERYLFYLRSEGLVASGFDGRLYQSATRAEMAHLLANLLPEEFLPPINGDIVTPAYALRLFVADVTDYTPYARDILTLYRCGIAAGSDAKGSFHPDSHITRGAAAAMLTRLADPSLRITLDWDLAAEYTAKGTSYGDLIAPGSYVSAPATEEELDASLRHMLAAGSDSLTLQYGSMNADGAARLMETALLAVKRRCEQGYNQVECKYNLTGTVLLRFGVTVPDGNAQAFRSQALAQAIAVHDALWADGDLTRSMTQLEKARVYYDWICEHTVYDSEATDSSASHLPYGVFANGLAVCDGYTGAYNLLLRLEDIDCYALGNGEHLWTVAVLDGTEYHIDTTWGDEAPSPNRFFAMTPEESFAFHSW